MRKLKFKRVCIINSDTNQYEYMMEDYNPNLTDMNILCSIFEVTKHVWKGHNMYKVVRRADNTIRYDRYEVYVVTQYVPNWYENLRRKVLGW